MAQQLTKNTFRIEIQTIAPDDNFEKVVIEAIDECLSSLECVNKEVFYKYIEEKYNIKKKEIPNKIKEFSDSIEEIFGEAAKLIEIEIIQKLHSKTQEFNYRPKKRDLVFNEYMAALHMAFSNY